MAELEIRDGSAARDLVVVSDDRIAIDVAGIRAVLEDRDRLRAALEAIASQIPGDAGHFARAALEGYEDG